MCSFFARDGWAFCMIEVERGPGGSGRDVMIPLTGIHIFESCTVGLFGNGQGRAGRVKGKGMLHVQILWEVTE